MSAEIIGLHGPTVREIATSVKLREDDIADLLVIARYKNGNVEIAMSSMGADRALWLAEFAKKKVFAP